MTPFRTITAAVGLPLVLTCEHASCAVPEPYANLGLAPATLRDHIGWDIGAAAVTEGLAKQLAAPAVMSEVSRLVIDCNRGLSDADLIVEESDRVVVPGNVAISRDEREHRVARYYEPYHAAVDEVVAAHAGALLFSVHSFTPSIQGVDRPFDIGVLFDSFEDEARVLGSALANAGLRVRYNEPYSGMDGLIYSARTHGLRHRRRYLEIEINNGIIRDQAGVTSIADQLATALRRIL